MWEMEGEGGSALEPTLLTEAAGGERGGENQAGEEEEEEEEEEEGALDLANRFEGPSLPPPPAYTDRRCA